MARPRTREGYASWLQDQRVRLDPSLQRSTATVLPLDDRLLVGLRRHEGVHLRDQARRCGWDDHSCDAHLPDLEVRWRGAEERGLLVQEAGRWRLSDPEGMALSNQVLVELVCWWDQLPVALTGLAPVAD